MSSNSQHIIINRDNYQEYFLLYADGELNAEQCDTVERFAAVHPDLQEELELLLTARLDAEPIIFMDKESLLADSMKASVIDESLLLYIDDELKGAEKKAIETQINSDPAYGLQYQLLQKTKLDKSEQIVYPYKEELYRSTEERRKPAYWWQAAAAVAILLGWSIFSYMDDTETGNTDPVVAINKQREAAKPAPATPEQPQTIIPSAPEATPSERLDVSPSTEAVASTATDQESKKNTGTLVRERAETKGSDLAIAPTVAQPVTTSADLPPVSNPAIGDVAAVRTEEVTPQHNFNTPTVTTTAADPYHKVEATHTTDVQEAVVKNNDKKGSLRGFLRKTTRFIERRTGIDPTDGDDELMIGAVAIKL